MKLSTLIAVKFMVEAICRSTSKSDLFIGKSADLFGYDICALRKRHRQLSRCTGYIAELDNIWDSSETRPLKVVCDQFLPFVLRPLQI
jgi:hypothetical protein